MKMMIRHLGLLLLTALLSMMTVMANGQNETFNSEQKSQTINAFMIWKYIGNLNVPLYDSANPNQKVTYSWYKAEKIFGEKVQSAETPFRVEEITYKNGKAHFYKIPVEYSEYVSRGHLERVRRTDYLKFIWENNTIVKIEIYDEKGHEQRTCHLTFPYTICKVKNFTTQSVPKWGLLLQHLEDRHMGYDYEILVYAISSGRNLYAICESGSEHYNRVEHKDIWMADRTPYYFGDRGYILLGSLLDSGAFKCNRGLILDNKKWNYESGQVTIGAGSNPYYSINPSDEDSYYCEKTIE